MQMDQVKVIIGNTSPFQGWVLVKLKYLVQPFGTSTGTFLRNVFSTSTFDTQISYIYLKSSVNQYALNVSN